MNGIEINRVWAMPSKNTFQIKPVYELLKSELKEGLLVVDPFVGQSNPIALGHFPVSCSTNDLNKNIEADNHMDAIDFLKAKRTNSVDCVLFDPPYSPRQISECYKSIGKDTMGGELTRSSFYSKLKEEIARIIKPGGKAISCSWNSNGIGKKRGFELKRILMVAHGGWHNDTIIIVEQKLQEVGA